MKESKEPPTAKENCRSGWLLKQNRSESEREREREIDLGKRK